MSLFLLIDFSGCVPECFTHGLEKCQFTGGIFQPLKKD